jgi:hypothetical protein
VLHPSKLWTWNNCSEKIRSLKGRNGFPDNDKISFLLYVLNLNNGNLIDSLTCNEVEYFTKPGMSILRTVFYVLSAYSEADDIKPSGKYVSSKQFRGTKFTQRRLIGVRQSLVNHFTPDFNMLLKVTNILGGKRIDFPTGDVAVKIFILPRIPITFVLTLADNEFSADSRIYFDETIESFFDSEQIYFLTYLTIERIMEISKNESFQSARLFARKREWLS